MVKIRELQGKTRVYIVSKREEVKELLAEEKGENYRAI